MGSRILFQWTWTSRGPGPNSEGGWSTAAAGLWGEPELAQEPSRAALRQHPSSLVGTPETLTIPQQEEA